MNAPADELVGAPLFIVGCPGSGTGVVGEILGAHGRVAYWDGPSDLASCYRRLLRGEVNAAEARAAYLDACRRWLSARSLSSIQRFAVRCPGHALVVTFLAGAFPDARVLHVLRDGRAVVRSLLTGGPIARSHGSSWRADDQAMCGSTDWVPATRRAEFEAATAVERAALTWVIHVRAGLEGRAVAPDRYFEIRYEDLVADPAGWGGRVLAFAGVGVERAVERVLARICPVSDEERPVAGSEERALAEAKAGDLLRELGYEV